MQPETITTPSFLLDGLRNDHFILRVVGDALAAEGILDGDLVVVRRQQTAQPGELVVARVGDEATIKRLHPGPDGAARLCPVKPGEPDIVVAAADLRIDGVPTGLMRKLR